MEYPCESRIGANTMVTEVSRSPDQTRHTDPSIRARPVERGDAKHYILHTRTFEQSIVPRFGESGLGVWSVVREISNISR